MITVVNHCVKSVKIRSFFWSVFSRIRTEYGENRSISPYSGRIRENSHQKTPYLDTFHAVNKVHHQPFLNKLPNNLKLLKEQFYLSKLNELVMNKNKNINYSSLQKKGWKNKNGFIIKNNRLIPFIVVTHQYCTDWWIVL